MNRLRDACAAATLLALGVGLVVTLGVVGLVAGKLGHLLGDDKPSGL